MCWSSTWPSTAGTRPAAMARGKLRIYLGAAPGVGKTYAMLNEGWRAHTRGKDVVIGYVETYDRPNTRAQIRDLEVLPRATVEDRKSTRLNSSHQSTSRMPS